jgi:hypothetical protein
MTAPSSLYSNLSTRLRNHVLQPRGSCWFARLFHAFPTWRADPVDLVKGDAITYRRPAELDPAGSLSQSSGEPEVIADHFAQLVKEGTEINKF